MKHNILSTGFTVGVPNANIFYEKLFFFPPLSCDSCKEEKRCQWIQKAHMKIENITSLHNSFMLHMSCSTKIQMTLCSSVPAMPIVTGHGTYVLKPFLKSCWGSLHKRPRPFPSSKWIEN